jgi:uncharacterized repeat protein (TIGR01451 family)
MKHLNRMIAVLGGLVAMTLGASPAFASGTASGSTIANTASVGYNVGGVPQTAVNSNTNNIIVDRKVTVSVVETGTATTSVVPGQTLAVTTFTVTNSSNATIDIGLTGANETTGSTVAHTGTDAFDITSLTMYRETGGVAGFDATDVVVTFLDELPADAIRTVYIVGTVPAGATNGQIAGVTLLGTAAEGGGPSALGATITATAGANTAGVDTVLLDTANASALATDGANDGRSADDDDYTVSAAGVTVLKTSKIIEDPVNTIASGNAANAKMIPGATVEYCIQVTNASGGAAADNVAVSDPLPAQTTFVTGSIRLNGTVTAAVCNADGVAGGTFASSTVSGNLGTVAAGTTRTLYFRVTIN